MSTLLMDTKNLYSEKNNKVSHFNNINNNNYKNSSKSNLYNNNKNNNNKNNNNNNNNCYTRSNSSGIYNCSNSDKNSNSNNNSNSNTNSNSNENDNDNDNDQLLDNIINLKLKKPKKWGWELSTSKSSPNIAFPRICLYDHKGDLLAEADEADQTYGTNIQEENKTSTLSSSSSIIASDLINNNDINKNLSILSSSSSGKNRKEKRSISSSSFLELNENLNAFVDYLENKGINYELNHHHLSSPHHDIKHSKSISNINQFNKIKTGIPTQISSSVSPSSSILRRRCSISVPYSYNNDDINNNNVDSEYLPFKIGNHDKNDKEKSCHSTINKIRSMSSNCATNNNKQNDIGSNINVDDCYKKGAGSNQIQKRKILPYSAIGKKIEKNLPNTKNINDTIVSSDSDESDDNDKNNNHNNNKTIEIDNEKIKIISENKNEEISDLETPIWVQSAKGLIKRDMNSKEFDHLRPKTYKKSKSVNLDYLIDETQNTNWDYEKKLSDGVIRNSSLRKVRNKFLSPQKEVRFDLQKSKSATNLLDVSSASKTNISDDNSKSSRKSRRSSSNETPSKFSKSILERMSAHRMGSSTESQEIKISTVNHGPRYFLRSSRAGTLVVCEDVINNRRKRNKSIHRISEKFNEFNEKLPTVKDNKLQQNLLNNGKNNNKFYDEAINKLDNLISKVNLRQKDKINNTKQIKLRNSNPILLEENDKQFDDKNIENISDKPQTFNTVRKKSESDNITKQQKNIRRCVSAGNIYLSSSEDENSKPIKKEIKLKRRRKTPMKYQKGDNILALKSGNLSNDIQSVRTPIANVIKNEPSDDILLRFMESLTSFQQYPVVPVDNDECQQYQQNYTDYLSKKFNTTSDSILKDDNQIDFEIIRKNSNNSSKNNINNNQKKNNNNFINNNNNNNNTNNNVDDCYNKINYLNEENNNNDNNNVLLLNDSILYRNDSLNTNQNSNPSDIIDFVVVQNNMGSNVSRNSSKTNQQQSETTNRPRRRTHSSVNNHQHHHHHHHHHSQTESNIISASPLKGVVEVTPTSVGSLITQTDCSVVEYVTHRNIHQQHQQQNHHILSQNNDSSGNSSSNIGGSGNSSGIGGGSSSNSSTNCDKENIASTSSGNSGTSNNIIINNNNIVGCGNTIVVSGTSTSNTSKLKQVKPDLQLTLPITRTNFDPSCDQGYGSERSPEDELPPLLSSSNFNAKEFQKQKQKQQQNQHQHPTMTMMSTEYPINGNNGNVVECCEDGNEFVYDFITEDCTFSVSIVKGSRGLGFSICGGVDTNTAFPGLIRIKRLFPHQAAWSTGKLQTGDIILESNSIPLTGLTNYEALEVLRTLPNDVELLICRPVDEQYKKLSPPTEPPKPPQRHQQQSIQTQTVLEDIGGIIVPPQYHQFQQHNSPYLTDTVDFSTTTIIPTNCYGEFEIFMIKQQGSLGFTIHKEDESVLGHYVRALVREPATTDGRIKPGDKIVAVNDIQLSPMTHEQAVIFLRQSGDIVKLRLYRDEPNTPDEEPPSPTVTERENSFCGSSSSSHKKPHLRPEAINLLTDLAHKKQNSQGDSTESSNLSTSSSPRRLKRGYKSQSEQDAQSDSKSSNSNPVYLVSSQTTTLCSDSEQSIDSQCSYIIQPGENINEISSVSPNSGKSNRPNYLDLSNSNSSDGNTIRKTKYQFGACTNTYELNNLGNDELDAPIHNHHQPHQLQQHHTNNLTNSNNQQSINNEFNSLPCDVLLGSSKKYSESEFDNDDIDIDYISNTNNNICHKNPLYQSVHVQQSQSQTQTQMQSQSQSQLQSQSQSQSQVENNFENNQTDFKNTSAHGNESLLKWKGVVLSVEENENQQKNENTQGCNNSNVTNIGITTDIFVIDNSVNGGKSETQTNEIGSATTTTTTTQQKIFSLTSNNENFNLNQNTIDENASGSLSLTTINDVSRKQQFPDCIEGYRIVSVELNRGWNSRLGFSLQPSKEFQNKSYISAVYNDSVAARDGRLRVGDILISVNEESIENMSTTEIIDFLRIIRGAILITVLRKDSQQQQQQQ